MLLLLIVLAWLMTRTMLNSGSAVGFLLSQGVDSICYYATGNKIVNQSSTSYGASYTTNDIIGVALNLDDNQITFYKNGVSQELFHIRFLAVIFFQRHLMRWVTQLQLIDLILVKIVAKVSSANADGNGFGTFDYAVPSGFFSPLHSQST